MILRLPGLVIALTLAGLGGRAFAADLELRDVAARVVVVTEARDDVKVTVLKTNPRLPIWISDVGGKVIVSGQQHDLWTRLFGGGLINCHVTDHGLHVTVFGVGGFDEDQLPYLLVRMPLDARIASRGGIAGSLPTANNLDLSIGGCDSWTIGKVAGKLTLHEAGAPKVRTGDLGSLWADLAGAGDLSTHAIADGLDTHVAGAGGIRATAVSGPINVHIAGQGDLNLGPGHSPQMNVDIAGQGDVNYAGTADTLRVNIAGQGDVRVARVTGQIDKNIAGQGDVVVGGR